MRSTRNGGATECGGKMSWSTTSCQPINTAPTSSAPTNTIVVTSVFFGASVTETS